MTGFDATQVIANSEAKIAAGDRPDINTPSTWRPVDITDVLDGSWRPARPTVAARDDGAGLFYPRLVHTISSESEAGKTWLALAAAATELANGGAVVFVDFEDDKGGIVGRLLALNVPRDTIRARFAYIRPEDAITVSGGHDDLAAVLDDLTPTLVILDGITEAMVLHGLELKDNTDVAKFTAVLLRWIAARGPAVVALDHVVKARDGRSRYAIGGVHKLNAVNGAAYLLENRRPFGIGMVGRSGLFIAKDRPAQLRQRAVPARSGLFWYADLVLDSHDEVFVEASLETPVEHQGPWRPTVLMAAVSDALERAGRPLNKRDIEDRVTGKAATVRQAIAALIDDGYVTVETSGRQHAHLHTLVKPFAGDDT